MSDTTHTSGNALDRCICVHAEQNAFLTAARFGIALEDATLYTTHSPCLSCLKEAVQIGISRIVYQAWYGGSHPKSVVAQYDRLAAHLQNEDPTRFEVVGGGTPTVVDDGQIDPYGDDSDEAVPLEPPKAA